MAPLHHDSVQEIIHKNYMYVLITIVHVISWCRGAIYKPVLINPPMFPIT
jgi:hypothetical protein